MLTKLLEKDLVPHQLIRARIRQLLRQRLKDESVPDKTALENKKRAMVLLLSASEIAYETKAANEQHYELPTEFFKLVLGKHLKYSCGLWGAGVNSLDEAEERMLSLCCKRADIRDGQEILDMGCGWGALSIYIAQRFPGSAVTAVSNSRTQKQYIDQRVRELELNNLRVITADANTFEIPQRFDRIVSVEMFEHLRNYRNLFHNLSNMLKEGGKMFVHVFVHRDLTYLFEVKDESDWISKYFFTGGIMPSSDLFFHFNEHLEVRQKWDVEGTHYAKTAEGWLSNMLLHREQVMQIMRSHYGKEAGKWFVYWKIFFMACAELWSYRNGSEWFVSHYLFEKKPGSGN